jgi:hypothetical protein
MLILKAINFEIYFIVLLFNIYYFLFERFIAVDFIISV